MRRYNCTEFNYIGGILPILLKAEPTSSDADNPLRIMIGAGANKETFAAFEQRFNVKLVESYGMSEIGAPLGNKLDDRKPGSCGVLNPDYQIRLIDDLGNEVGANTPGELLVRPLKPYSMMLEYYAMPEKPSKLGETFGFTRGTTCKEMIRVITILLTERKMRCAVAGRTYLHSKWSGALIHIQLF